jgi:hypothetical protein
MNKERYFGVSPSSQNPNGEPTAVCFWRWAELLPDGFGATGSPRFRFGSNRGDAANLNDCVEMAQSHGFVWEPHDKRRWGTYAFAQTNIPK